MRRTESSPASELRVTFLGTGTSIGVPVPTCDCPVCRSDDPRDRRLRPSVLLEWPGASVIVDTATDLREQCLRARIPRIDAVLLTHTHADHLMGLDDLRIYNWRQRAAIPIYGSEETCRSVRRTFAYVFDSEPAESTRPTVELKAIDARFALLGREVTPVPLLHGSLPILGYRVGGLAYLTDVSQIPASSYALLNDLDLLVISAPRRRPLPTHLTIDQALEQSARIAPRRTLLTHLSHEVHHATVEAELPEGIDLAYDGLCLQLC